MEKGSAVTRKDGLDAVKNKIPNVSGFLLTSTFNSKITEVENKIPDIRNFVTSTKLSNELNGFVEKIIIAQKLLKLKIIKNRN